MNMMTKGRPAALLPRADLFALFERDEIEAAVEALIAHLDAIDGDPDTGDQAWPENDGPSWMLVIDPAARFEDAEDGHDHEEDKSDFENTWQETGNDRQPAMAGGGLGHVEDDVEHDGKHLRAPHVARVRGTNCHVDRRPWGPSFYLRDQHPAPFGIEAMGWKARA